MGVDVRPAGSPSIVDSRAAVDTSAASSAPEHRPAQPQPDMAEEMEVDMPRSEPNGTAVAERPRTDQPGADSSTPSRYPDTAVAAFAAFFEQASPGVYRTALAAAHDPELADDATAEAFARAFSHWEQLADHPHPLGWVVRTALNYLTSCHRRLRREVDLPLPEQPTPPPGTLRLDLVSVLRTLPQRQIEVVAMRYLCDMESAQIAGVLGITPQTVAVHHHRAMQTLRAALDDQEDP